LAKNKNPKPADPALAGACPRCGAAAGAKCRNCLGKGKATCKERKAGPRLAADCTYCGQRAGFACKDVFGKDKEPCAERGRPGVRAKKLAKKADEMNARALKAYGGDNTLLTDFYGGADELLAAEGVEKATPEAVAADRLQRERLGLNDGGMAEWDLRHALNWITLRYMRREVAKAIGAEWEGRLWVACERTYRTNFDYIVSRYADCVCEGKRFELEFVRHVDKGAPTQWNPSGERFRLEVVAAWPPEGFAPVMARAEFNARFKLVQMHHWRPEAGGDDPTGLFERTIGALPQRA
jgi:hypothetical protein